MSCTNNTPSTVPGPTGPRGPRGYTGNTGPSGRNGSNGVDGAPGAVQDISGKVSKGELFLNVKDYGAIGNGLADDTAAVQVWLNAGGVRLTNGTYRIVTGLTVTGNNRRFTMENAKIVGDGVGIDILTFTGDNADVNGAVLDGVNKARYGVRTTGARPSVRNCVIENLSSTGSTARGIECTTGTGATITGNRIRNIFSTGNTTFGDSNGMSRGIVITNTVAATGSTLISENLVESITGEEGDGIVVLFSDGESLFNLQCRTVIEKNTIRNVSRRFIKVQGSGCKVSRNTLEHDGVVPAYPSNAIDFINSNDATIVGNEINDHPLSNTISIAGDTERIVSKCRVSGNIIRVNDAKANTTVYLNYTKDCVIDNNVIYGGGRSIIAGYSDALLIENNVHFGGVIASKSFDANGTNTGVVMRKNINMNRARTSYISNVGTGAITDLNTTLV